MESKKEVGIKLGYCRITKTRTKFSYQEDGNDLEFYIDRDPKTSMATLWLRPGALDAFPYFLSRLLREHLKVVYQDIKHSLDK